MVKRDVRRHRVEADEKWYRDWQQSLAEVEGEVPDFEERRQLLFQAANERTLSGAIRRAVHASSLSLPEIVARIGVSHREFSDFLAGKQSLSSQTFDHLAVLLGYELVPSDHHDGP